MVVEGSRPIDWLILVVDLCVLLAVLWLEVPEWRHKRRCKRIARQLQPLSDKGIQLQTGTPNPRTSQGMQAFRRWESEVNAWSDETHDFLAQNSSTAASAFLLIVNAQVADRIVRSPDGNMFSLSGGWADTYQIFQLKLSNLQMIVQNPEAYF
jgi:hypothetical protein